MKAVATQKQTTDNLSTHTDENDPKLMASRSTLTQKTQDCQTTKSDYEVFLALIIYHKFSKFNK
jgi:hypothetical protein